MANIKTKRKRVKFASDNVAGACPEVLDAILKVNEGDSAPYGNDQISTELQNKFSEIFEKDVIVFPIASGYLLKHILPFVQSDIGIRMECHVMMWFGGFIG